MSWRTRDRGLWLTLAVLTVLLVVLAALQYRWIGEIGRAEGERRQARLERSAWRFDSAFDRELWQVQNAFRLDPEEAASDRRPVLLERLAAWRRSEHGALVSGLLLAARTPSGDVTLEGCPAGGSAFQGVPWPPELEPLRARLRTTGESRGAFPARPGTLLEPPLALAVPIVDVTEGTPAGPRWGQFQLAGVVLLQLDLAYMRDHLLPQLAETHLGPLADSELEMAVVRRADRSVVYSSDPAFAAYAPRSGDVERSLGGRSGRPAPDRPQAGRGPATEPPGREMPAPGDEPSAWLLVARHRGGTLQQAVSSIRRRNLAAGLGLLGLLGAAAVILATGAQRARRLAQQQMEFVAGVTHELNTPLAAIRSAGQNLADGIVTDTERVRRYGHLIEKEGDRLTALVSQVLDFAGIESGSRAYAAEPLSVATVVDEVLRDHRLVLDQAGMTVERDVPAGLPEVQGDATALRRALSNLVANAAKFAAPGRWIAVRASARPDGGGVVLRVEDRGPGIPREERERVFEPFYRGPAAESNATPGSGLGLSLVRHVVRAHGGRVHVEGREGGGAAVVVELPVAAAGGDQKA